MESTSQFVALDRLFAVATSILPNGRKHAHPAVARARALVANSASAKYGDAAEYGDLERDLPPESLDELKRRVRELDALEERALDAYRRERFDLAERLDAEYAVLVEELEAVEAELREGDSYEDLEPGEWDGGRLGHRTEPGTEEGQRDIVFALAQLYEEFLGEPDVHSRFGRLGEDPDPATVRDRFSSSPFPVRTREDVLAYYAMRTIEDTYHRPIEKKDPKLLVEAVKDAHERVTSLKGRIAGSSQRDLEPNRGQSWEDVGRVFDETFDVIDEQFPDFGEAELYEDDAAAFDNGAGSERQFAYCMDGSPIHIGFAPKARQLPLNRLRGLMRHEFGHALEFRYGVAELERMLGRKLPEYSERRADVIAEHVFGEPILYDHANVQCVRVAGAKQRRPRHLPDRKEKLKPNISAAEADIEVRFPRTPGRPGYVRMNVQEDGHTITVATARLRVGEHDVQVQEVEVAEDYRGQGFGRRLYNEVFRAAGQRGLKVESDTRRSEAAEGFWKRLEARGVARGVGSGGEKLVPRSDRTFSFRSSGSWPYLMWVVDDPAAAAEESV